MAPVAPTTITPPSASCPQRKVRKNVRTLSEEEKRALVEAMRRAMASGALQQVMGLHGVPADTTICGTRGNSVPCCPHDENWPAFLPWHRNYMVQLEEVLGLPLPYWDWTEDSSWPNLFEPILKDIHDNAGIDVIAGLNEFGTAGQCDPANPGGLDAYRARQRGIAHSNFLQEQPNFKRQIGLAFIKENYREFSSQLSNPHNMVHNTNPCNLRPTLVAAWDPVFFLHHAFVDMQYAYWQELQRLRGRPMQVPQHTQPLRPFDNPQYNPVASTLAASRADQGYDYRAAFCYEYDRLSFAGQTPEEFHQARTSRFTAQCDPSGSCLGLEIGDDVFMGVVVPRRASASILRFTLCAEDACVPAGSTATFGAGKADAVTGPVSSATHKLVEVDVTHVVKEQEWFESVLEGRLVESEFEGLPPPVVIMRAEDEPSGGQVALSAEQALLYGDLLEAYQVDDFQEGEI